MPCVVEGALEIALVVIPLWCKDVQYEWLAFECFGVEFLSS